jgi:hypothetical protein
MKKFSVKEFMYKSDPTTNIVTRIVESVKENISWQEAKELRKTDKSYWITFYNPNVVNQNTIWKI